MFRKTQGAYIFAHDLCRQVSSYSHKVSSISLMDFQSFAYCSPFAWRSSSSNQSINCPFCRLRANLSLTPTIKCERADRPIQSLVFATWHFEFFEAKCCRISFQLTTLSNWSYYDDNETSPHTISRTYIAHLYRLLSCFLSHLG